jgi:hypothetical protein
MLPLIIGTYASYLYESYRSRTIRWGLIAYALVLVLVSLAVTEEYRLMLLAWTMLPVGVIAMAQ